MYTVYKAHNRNNGKSYIGITSRNESARWKEHLSRARCGERNNRLYAAIRKHGVNAFSLEVIAKVQTEDEVREAEWFYIGKHDSYRNGYNCNLGGAGFLEFPEAIRLKIGTAQKGKIISESTRLKMSAAKREDSSCAANFGLHVNKGESNPKAKRYLIRYPDKTEHIVEGLRAFCRRIGVSYAKFTSKGGTYGYRILRTFNDQPEKA